MDLQNTVRVTRQAPQPLDLPSLDAAVMPPAVGNNWTDRAFHPTHSKSQKLLNELNGHFSVTHKPRAPLRPPTLSTLTTEEAMSRLQAPRRGTAELGGKESYDGGLSSATFALPFQAYFLEAMPHTPEKQRTRYVTLTFFPADESLSIHEHALPNSGLRGGLLLRRMQVPANCRTRDAHPQEEFINLNHLRVGHTVHIYGVDYILYDADSFTRRVLEANNIECAPRLTTPDRTAKSEKFLSPRHRAPRSADRDFGGGGQENSGLLLRFMGIFDDRENEGGTVHLLDVVYFVDDDTVAITRKPTPGEATPLLFLSRRRLPRAPETTKELQFASRLSGAAVSDVRREDCYTTKDLFVGQRLNVYGRDVILFDCDQFTREYYANRLSLSQGPALDISSFLSTLKHGSLGRVMPEAVAEKNVATVTPIAALCGEEKTRRFQLRIHRPCTESDKRRVFVLVIYPETEEISIFEVPIRGSSNHGGTVLSRQKLESISEFSQHKVKEFSVGMTFAFGGSLFDVVAHDDNRPERTWMPVHSVKESLSHLNVLLKSRYKTATAAFLALDQDRDGVISADELAGSLLKHQLATSNEVLGVFTALDSNNKGYLAFADLLTFWMQPRDANANTGRQSMVAQHEFERLRLTLQRNAVLKILKQHLDARCLTGAEMFRKLSRMPRAYKGRREIPLNALTNPSKDCVITPTQLRRGVQELLGLHLSEDEMYLLLAFFFPSIGGEATHRLEDEDMDHAVDVWTFHHLCTEMDALCQLNPTPSAPQTHSFDHRRSPI